MRSVFAIPRRGLSDVTASLDALSPDQRDPWLVDEVLYITIVTVEDEFWESDGFEGMHNASAHQPGWIVMVDVSGRADGTVEVRRLLRTLLDQGGAAFDDHSDHPWTLAEIESDARFDGLTFFDFRGAYERHQSNLATDGEASASRHERTS
jgi:hypothetical protein